MLNNQNNEMGLDEALLNFIKKNENENQDKVLLYVVIKKVYKDYLIVYNWCLNNCNDEH